MDKAVLRRKMKYTRKMLTPGYRAVASKRICSNLMKCGLTTPGSHVMVYKSIGSEVDTTDIISALYEAGCVVSLPRIEGKEEISARIFCPKDLLIADANGILEPSADAIYVLPEEIDVILLPGLAFDHHGYRLGYGGGYYDRYLTRLRVDCLRVGLCYAIQIIDRVPYEPYDMRVDYLMDENSLIVCS